MKTFDAISAGFLLAKRNWVLVGLIFAINLGVHLVSLTLLKNNPSNFEEMAADPAFLPFVFFSFLIAILVQGGLCGSVFSLLKKESPGVLEFTQFSRKFFPRMAGIAIIYALVVTGFFIGSRALASLVTSTGAAFLGAVGGLVALIGIAASAVAFVLLFFSHYAMVSGDLGVVHSLKASIDFVKPRALAVVGLLLLVGLIWLGITSVSSSMVSLIKFAVGQNVVSRLLGALLQSAVLSFLNVGISGCYMSFFLGETSSPSAPDQEGLA